MNSEALPPVLIANNRYKSNTPDSRFSSTLKPEIRSFPRKGSEKSNPLSLREIDHDSRTIDINLKSSMNTKQYNTLSASSYDKKDVANLKFLKYKFNPNEHSENETMQKSGDEQDYGQVQRNDFKIESISDILNNPHLYFQDERSPSIYKKLFLQHEHELHK